VENALFAFSKEEGKSPVLVGGIFLLPAFPLPFFMR
jgi:hypothetical protein